MTIVTSGLTYRTICPDRDAALSYDNYRDACIASFGNDRECMSRERRSRWLGEKTEEYPDGFVLAFHGEQCVGQLELQSPYGLPTGYINLYCVCPAFRGKGFGRALHVYTERYFRSWEARRIDLHVSPTNQRAVGFYRAMGYEFVRREGRVWRMRKDLT